MCAAVCLDIDIDIDIAIAIAIAIDVMIDVRKDRYSSNPFVKPVQEDLPDAILFGGRPVDGMEVSVVVFPQELLVNAVSRRLGQGHC